MKIKPEKLKKGDTIGIISPAGVVKDQKMLENAVNYFESQGYKVKTAPHVLDKEAYLAGKDAQRLSDLENMFCNDEVNAILCSRGGYGSFRILNDINYDLVRNNPKIFVGYSDITALLVNFYQKSGLVGFHGPLFVSDFGRDNVNEYTEKVFWQVLRSKNTENFSDFHNPVEYHCLKPGKVQGELIGGNLAIMCGLLGTPFMPDISGKILFLEDIGEPLYKIDRMITRLKLAGVFEKISGLLFTEFTSVTGTDNNELTLLDLLLDLAGDLKIPAGYGFPAGHGEMKATLPLGVEYFFDSKDFQLRLIEDYLL